MDLNELVLNREKKLIQATEVIEELQNCGQESIQKLKAQVMSELELKSDELQIEVDRVEMERQELAEERVRLQKGFETRLAELEAQYSAESSICENKNRTEVSRLTIQTEN